MSPHGHTQPCQYATAATRGGVRRSTATAPLTRNAPAPQPESNLQAAACAYLPVDCSRLMIRARAQEYKAISAPPGAAASGCRWFQSRGATRDSLVLLCPLPPP